MENEEGKPITCQKCGWAWRYKGGMPEQGYATCPSCRTKVKISQKKEEVD